MLDECRFCLYRDFQQYKYGKQGVIKCIFNRSCMYVSVQYLLLCVGSCKVDSLNKPMTAIVRLCVCHMMNSDVLTLDHY